MYRTETLGLHHGTNGAVQRRRARHSRSIALLALVAVAGTTALASEPGNDTSSGADQLMAGPEGGMFHLSLEARPDCEELAPLVGVFNASGGLIKSDIDYLDEISLASARTFRVTGSNDQNFDGLNDAIPSLGHGLLGDLDIEVWYLDATGEYMDIDTDQQESERFVTGSEVFSWSFNVPPGAAEAEVYTDWYGGGTGDCAGSDVDFMVINGLEPGASYNMSVFGLSNVYVASFDGLWNEEAWAGDDGPTVLLVEADSLGRVRLAVSSNLDTDFDGLDDDGLPHGLAGAYTVSVSRTNPPPVCPANYNGDFELDIVDFLAFIDDFSVCEQQPAPCGTMGDTDINGDTHVDILDFLDFMQSFGEGCDLPTLPTSPGNLAITFPTPGTVRVSWSDRSDNEDYFTVVLDDEDEIHAELSTAPNTTYAEFEIGDQLVAGSILTATVCATNSMGDACDSKQESVPSQCPNPPSPLTWDFVKAGTIELNWVDMCNAEVSYNVARTTGTDPDFDRIATLGPDTTSHRVRGLLSGTTYHFKVRGILEGPNTPYSNVVTVSVPSSPPAAPTSLRVDNLWSRTIDLAWIDNSGNERVFRIARSTNGTDFDNIGTNDANDNTFRVEGLQPNTVYWFKVRAANLAGYSEYANTLMVTTPSDPPTIPSPPSNCRIGDIDPCSAVVRWDDNSNNEDTFRVAISKDGVNFDNADVVDANVTSVRVSNLCPETAYWVKVRARNEAGTSDYSNTAVFTTQRLRAPTNLVASRDTSTPELDVVITWELTGDCRDGYRLARSRDNVNFGNIAVLGPNESSYRDPNVERDVRYYYKVRAYKECDGQTFFSDHSNTDSAIAR